MANKLIIEKKAQVVDEITSNIKNSAGVVFVDYRGLNDEELTSLRKSLRDNDSSIKVYKNTLTKRALDSLDIKLDECVSGPSAMVFSDDSILPVKIVSNFAKEHEALSIKGGIIDGKISTLEELKKIATLPSRDGVLTMLASGLIGTVKNLSIALDLYAKQKEQ